MSTILFTVPAWRRNWKKIQFFKFLLVSGKSHSSEKCARGVFKHPFFCKLEKKWRGAVATFKKICKKSHKAKKPAQKTFWSWAGLEPVLLLGRSQKILQKIKSRSYISVAVSGSQLMKLIKTVTSLVFKKSLLKSAFFYEKRRLETYKRCTTAKQKVKNRDNTDRTKI